MILNNIGNIANNCWCEIPDHFTFVKLDEYVIMPNHVHGIIIINKKNVENIGNIENNVEMQNFASLRLNINKHIYENIHEKKNQFGPQSRNLASIIRGFKIGVTKNAKKENTDFSWQSRYYDHIIKDDKDLNRIRVYIKSNPLNWDVDEEIVKKYNNMFSKKCREK